MEEKKGRENEKTMVEEQNGNGGDFLFIVGREVDAQKEISYREYASPDST